MTFPEYLARRRVTRTPAGDFTQDARQDPNLPNVQSWRELRGYLAGMAACRDAFPAALAVWRGYRAAIRCKA